jgi:hypothetical protein
MSVVALFDRAHVTFPIYKSRDRRLALIGPHCEMTKEELGSNLLDKDCSLARSSKSDEKAHRKSKERRKILSDVKIVGTMAMTSKYRP